jgi:hypothetical protein
VVILYLFGIRLPVKFQIKQHQILILLTDARSQDLIDLVIGFFPVRR